MFRENSNFIQLHSILQNTYPPFYVFYILVNLIKLSAVNTVKSIQRHLTSCTTLLMCKKQSKLFLTGDANYHKKNTLTVLAQLLLIFQLKKVTVTILYSDIHSEKYEKHLQIIFGPTHPRFCGAGPSLNIILTINPKNNTMGYLRSYRWTNQIRPQGCHTIQLLLQLTCFMGLFLLSRDTFTRHDSSFCSASKDNVDSFVHYFFTIFFIFIPLSASLHLPRK